MKPLTSRFLLFIFTTVILACSSPKEDPVAAAKAFYEALAIKDFKKAKQLATRESKTMLDLIESMSQMGADVKAEEEDLQKMKEAVYSNAEINGDMATVRVKMGEEENTVKLKKEEGTWKVALDKESLQETMNEKTGESMEDFNDAMENAANELEKAGDNLGQVLEKTGEALKKAGEAIKETKPNQ